MTNSLANFMANSAASRRPVRRKMLRAARKAATDRRSRTTAPPDRRFDLAQSSHVRNMSYRTMVRTPAALDVTLAKLAGCRSEEEIVAWAAGLRGDGSPELYAAIRKKFTALREQDGPHDQTPTSRASTTRKSA